MVIVSSDRVASLKCDAVRWHRSLVDPDLLQCAYLSYVCFGGRLGRDIETEPLKGSTLFA